MDGSVTILLHLQTIYYRDNNEVGGLCLHTMVFNSVERRMKMKYRTTSNNVIPTT